MFFVFDQCEMSGDVSMNVPMVLSQIGVPMGTIGHMASISAFEKVIQPAVQSKMAGQRAEPRKRVHLSMNLDASARSFPSFLPAGDPERLGKRGENARC